MKTYLYRGTYSTNAWRNLIADPVDIGEALGESIQMFGGKPIACFIMNEREPIGFVQFPDEASASAWNLHLLAQDSIVTAELTSLRSTGDFKLAMIRVAQTGQGDGQWE